MKANKSSFALAAALLTGTVSINATAAAVDKSYACVPKYVAEYYFETNEADILCDARSVNKEIGAILAANGCADTTHPASPADLIPQYKVTFDNGRPVKLKDCEMYDAVFMVMEL